MSETPSPLQIYHTSDFSVPVEPVRLHRLMAEVEEGEAVVFDLLEVVFVSEEEIVEVNRAHLGRDYVTDIISFSYGGDFGGEDLDPTSIGSDERDLRRLEGTLYCCAPRIAEQAGELGVPVREEFCRVVVHGMLHLAGYDDQTDAQRREMRRLEDHYLSASDC